MMHENRRLVVFPAEAETGREYFVFYGDGSVSADPLSIEEAVLEAKSHPGAMVQPALVIEP